MKNRPLCSILLWLIVWFAVSGIRGESGGETLASFLPEGETARLSGIVYRIEHAKISERIYLKNSSIDIGTAELLPGNSLVYLEEGNSASGLSIGNHIEVEGVCAYPESPDNPGGFDAKSYYAAQGIRLFLKKGRILENDGKAAPLKDALFRVREFFMGRLQAAGAGNDAGVLGAMILGDRTQLSSQTKELYQDAGIIHLLAISGLHISLTGMALYRLLRRFLPLGAAGAISGGVMAAYACMTGFPVSAVRAVLMFGIFLLAQTVGRSYDLPTSLASAAALLLAAQEKNITQAGFLLSFAAVCGVVLSGTWKSRPFKGTSLGISLGTQITTLPLIALFYYQIPLYSILLNLLVIPLMPLVLGFGLAGMAASAVSITLWRFLLAPAHYTLTAVEFLCGRVRLLPFSIITTGKPSPGRILFYYGALGAGLFLLSRYAAHARGKSGLRASPGALYKKERKNSAVLLKIDLLKLGFALILVAGIFFIHVPGRFTVTFLDVGQGDGCCIEHTDGSVYLVDGGSSSRENLAQYCLEPFLKSRGKDTVDCWLISHYDQDHVSGLLEILEGYERGLGGKNAAGITVRSILLPDACTDAEAAARIRALARENGIRVYMAARGDGLESGSLDLQVLSPERGKTYADTNEASMAVALRYQGFSALLTGDIQGAGEQELLESGLLEDIDVLKVAHHGSRNSTPEAFLAIVRPELSVISCQKDNSYGHPHAELLQRLESCGSAIARTDTSGAVSITVDRDGTYAATVMKDEIS